MKKGNTNQKETNKKKKLTTEEIHANKGFLKKEGNSLFKALMEEKKKNFKSILRENIK